MKNKSRFFHPSWLPAIEVWVHEEGHKSVIIGFVLGMFALLILSFTVFIRTRIWHNREVHTQELEILRRVEETCQYKPVEFETISGGFYVLCAAK